MPPTLDVVDVLSANEFMDTFIVVRRESGVNEQGRMAVTEKKIPTTGVVQPSGANTQERPKDYATGRKSCFVATQFRLRAQSNRYAPDLILWRGDDYLVETVEDYTNYGRGFVQAYCTSQDLQDAPPMGGTGSVN
jgi:galactose-6-phosphate isomerase